MRSPEVLTRLETKLAEFHRKHNFPIYLALTNKLTDDELLKLQSQYEKKYFDGKDGLAYIIQPEANAVHIVEPRFLRDKNGDVSDIEMPRLKVASHSLLQQKAVEIFKEMRKSHAVGLVFAEKFLFAELEAIDAHFMSIQENDSFAKKNEKKIVVIALSFGIFIIALSPFLVRFLSKIRSDHAVYTFPPASVPLRMNAKCGLILWATDYSGESRPPSPSEIKLPNFAELEQEEATL